MSTPNFSKNNSLGKYYVLSDDDIELFDKEFVREEIKSDLEKLNLPKGVYLNFYDGPNGRDYTGLLDINIEIDSAEDYWDDFTLKIILRHGYYTGANFDIIYEKGLSRVDLDYLYDYFVGDKVFEETIDKIIDTLESNFDKFCDIKLELVGVFSNGEAVYRQIK